MIEGLSGMRSATFSTLALIGGGMTQRGFSIQGYVPSVDEAQKGFDTGKRPARLI
jgi:hypothetical protein